jgi:hypothetical protein
MQNPYANGIPQVQAFLREFPKEIRPVAIDALAIYLLGDESHGLKHEPSYKYVNRYAGFPGLSFVTSTGKIVPGYASQAQFNYVHAMVSLGQMQPGQDNRTHDLVNAWEAIETGNGKTLTNTDPAAPWVIGTYQTRMHDLIGWRMAWDNINDNLNGGMRAAVTAVNAKLKELCEAEQ